LIEIKAKLQAIAAKSTSIKHDTLYILHDFGVGSDQHLGLLKSDNAEIEKPASPKNQQNASVAAVVPKRNLILVSRQSIRFL
jgi:hypothetical protein